MVKDDLPIWTQHRRESSKEKHLREIQFRILTKDGQIRWIEHVCQPISDQKSKFLGYRASNRDITKRKQSEEEVSQLREEFLHIARVAAIGELTASIAHELKQPLAAIRSNAQAAQRFLTRDEPDLDEFHDILTDIIKDDRRANEVIERLRTLLRKGDFRLMELDINELIHEIVPLINSYKIMRDISLELDLNDRLPPVMADRVQLQQVILNLILNSSEALMSESQNTRKIIVQTDLKDDQNVVSVRDNGPGIDTKDPMKLYEPFYTNKKEGMGMGLAISRSIIEAHKGHIWFENNPDSGVTFYFALPICKKADA
ncbi:MAG: ATP-binding protein [Candidatus Ranarchaeia archaeon]